MMNHFFSQGTSLEINVQPILKNYSCKGRLRLLVCTIKRVLNKMRGEKLWGSHYLLTILDAKTDVGTEPTYLCLHKKKSF